MKVKITLVPYMKLKEFAPGKSMNNLSGLLYNESTGELASLRSKGTLYVTAVDLRTLTVKYINIDSSEWSFVKIEE